MKWNRLASVGQQECVGARIFEWPKRPKRTVLSQLPARNPCIFESSVLSLNPTSRQVIVVGKCLSLSVSLWFTQWSSARLTACYNRCHCCSNTAHFHAIGCNRCLHSQTGKLMMILSQRPTMSWKNQHMLTRLSATFQDQMVCRTVYYCQQTIVVMPWFGLGSVGFGFWKKRWLWTRSECSILILFIVFLSCFSFGRWLFFC